MTISKSVRFAFVLVLAALSGASLGAATRANASQASVDVPVRVYDLEPMTIVEAAPTSEVITLPEVTIVGSARRGTVKASSRPARVVSQTVRVVTLDQGGRPGARAVRAWGI